MRLNFLPWKYFGEVWYLCYVLLFCSNGHCGIHSNGTECGEKAPAAVMTSEGLTDGGVMKDPMPCWGKPAAWIDYSGSVEGQTLGIAILNHPSSFRYPTRWHVRVYGLFAANPWGAGDFTGGAEHGEHTMKKGEAFGIDCRKANPDAPRISRNSASVRSRASPNIAIMCVSTR